MFRLMFLLLAIHLLFACSTDSPTQSDTDQGLPYNPDGYWNEPLFLGDGFEHVFHPSVSGDGRTLFVSKNSVISFSTRTDSLWSPLTDLPFAGMAPCVTFHGDTLCFENEGKIFMTTRSGDQWSDPLYCFDGSRPTVTREGRTIYYVLDGICTAVFEEGAWNLRGGLSVINALGEVTDPAVSGDGTVLLFSRKRTICPKDWEECGGYEIYSCRQENGVWQQPLSLGPAVNFTYENFAPCISWDKLTLYLSSSTPPWWKNPALPSGMYVSQWVNE